VFGSQGPGLGVSCFGFMVSFGVEFQGFIFVVQDEGRIGSYSGFRMRVGGSYWGFRMRVG